MGAWGIRTFENDGALDWLGDFSDDPSEKRITDTFTPVVVKASILEKLLGKTPSSAELDLDGEGVLAAAELVATYLGKPSPENPEELRSLPAIQLSPDIATRAIEAIDSMMRSSNLKDCWEGEEDRITDWTNDVADLRARLELTLTEQD